MRKTNAIRITKEGKKRIDSLIDSPYVNHFHKTLLKGISSRMPKNISKADCEIFETISNQYKGKML
jgi:hypothetical protein